MMVTRNRNRSFSRILVVAIVLMLAVGIFCGTGAAATNMGWSSYTGATTGDITITDASGSTLSHKTTLTISQDAVLDFGDAKTYALTGSTSRSTCGGLVDNLVFSDASKVLTIKNLHITSSGVINSTYGIGGLFGCIESKGTRLILENCSIDGLTIGSSSGGFYVGGLVGYASSASLNIEMRNCTIENCIISAGSDKVGSRCVGGLVGRAYSASMNLSGCMVEECKVWASDDGYVGGLVGSAPLASVMNMSECKVANSRVSGSSGVGGLVGSASSASMNMSGCMVEECTVYSICRAWTSGNRYVGGLVGYAYSASVVNMSGCMVEECKVWTSGGFYVGGLVGYVGSGRMNVSGCVVNGSEIEEEVNSISVGGLVGYAGSGGMNVSGCKVAFSNVTSGGDQAGGLVGYAYKGRVNLSECMVDRVYVSGHNYAGGLVGLADKGRMNVSECVVSGSEIKTGSGNEGGLVGRVYSASVNLSGCMVEECKVWSSGGHIVGGLVGSAASTSAMNMSGCMVEECTVLSSGSSYVGGLVGYADSVSIGFIGDGCWVNDSWVSGTSSIGSLMGYSHKTSMTTLVAPQHSAVYSASTTTGSSAIANNGFDGIGTKEQYGSPIDRYGLVAGKNYGYGSYKPGVVASGTCGVNLIWVLTDYGTLTISGTGVMYDYFSVTAPWYKYRSQMTKLVLPNRLTTIGDSAFKSCSGFTGPLTIPSSVTTIGDSAFKSCSGFTGPLTIPSSVTTIGDSAFESCSGFTGSLIIPKSVTTIGGCAFSCCSNLSAISVESSNQYYSSDEQGILYNKDKSSIICCPAGKTGTLTIPNSVTTIDEYAFVGCSGFTGSLTIPNNVTTIGECAFYGCSGITTVTIPSSVTTIDSDAFSFHHANSVIYAECPAGLVSGKYSSDRTALAANGTDNAYTFTVDTTYFPSGFPLTSENAPVKENYTFAGWYTTPSYSGSAVSTVADGQTLYAKWSGGTDGLQLYAGWNVVSTPKKLSSAYDTAAELFAGVNTTGHAVLTYNAQTKSWEQVTASTKIEPLNAYWIYSNESKNLPYEFSSTVSSPAMKNVYKGWNAVSLSADVPMSAAEAFGNINWYTYLEWNAASQAFKSALIKGGSGEHADTNRVSLWTGGWLFLNEDGTYMGFTA